MNLYFETGRKKNFCMMCEVQSHIRTALECPGRSLKPHSMLQKLRCKSYLDLLSVIWIKGWKEHFNNSGIYTFLNVLNIFNPPLKKMYFSTHGTKKMYFSTQT